MLTGDGAAPAPPKYAIVRDLIITSTRNATRNV